MRWAVTPPSSCTPHGPPRGPLVDRREVEHVIVDAQRCGHVQCRIAHRERVVVFGPAVHEVDEIATSLSGLVKGLSDALTLAGRRPEAERAAAERNAAVGEYVASAAEVNRAANERKRVIEQRKDAIEQALLEQARAEAEAREIQARMAAQAEERRQVRPSPLALYLLATPAPCPGGETGLSAI